MSKKQIIGAFLGLLALAIFIAAFVAALPLFMNTFDSRYLFFRAATVGAVLAVLAVIIAVYYAENRSDARLLGAFIALLCAFTTGFLGLFTNQWWADKGPLSISVLFLKETPIVTSRLGLSPSGVVKADFYDTYFIYKNEKYRFRTNKAVLSHAVPETMVKLPIKKGFWGFDIIDLD